MEEYLPISSFPIFCLVKSPVRTPNLELSCKCRDLPENSYE